MIQEQRAEAYLDTALIMMARFNGGQAKKLVETILGDGDNFSAVYIRGNKLFTDVLQSADAWYNDPALNGLAQYKTVDALVMVASGNVINGEEKELVPEVFIPQAESMNLQQYGPSENRSKLHWNNLRMLYQRGAYKIELMGIKEIKGQEGGLNPYKRGDFHMALLLKTLQQFRK